MASTRPNRDEAMDRLPLPYSIAMRLRDAGISDEVIARCIGVEPEGLQTVLLIARAKLDAAGYRETAE